MSRDISQAASSSSDILVEIRDQPKRNRSVHYPVDLDDNSKTNRLEHPGSRSAPVSRHRNVADLDGGSRSQAGGKWRLRDTSLGSVDYEPFLDEPTPPATIREQIDFSTVFANGLQRKKPSAAFRDENPDKVVSRWKGKKQQRRAPEQRITLFAFRLAMIEKAASGMGKLAFLWATVVILGGFATTITFINFWVVAVIIVAEGARIFNRSHELEWQNISTKSTPSGIFTSMMKLASNRLHRAPAQPTTGHQVPGNNEANMEAADTHNLPTTTTTHSSKINKKRLRRRPPEKVGFEERIQLRLGPTGVDGPKSRRTWSRPDIPLLPFLSNWITSRAVSVVLYIAQILSALLCIGLSLWRLSAQEFCGCTDMNVKVSMNLFYAMAVVESGLFLLEKGYLEYRMRYRDLLEEVRKEEFHGKLGDDFHKVLTSFYNAVYSQCLKGSVFEGLDMDLVSFGIQWLQSEHFQQQLYGAKLLNHFVLGNFTRNYQEDALIADALRRLGTTPGVIERLVEMLSWNSQDEEELVYEIASIISGLVAYDRNCARLVAVPGALDALVALLLPHGDARSDSGKKIQLRLTSLKILEFLSRAHKNSQKIGETKGLLSILVIFIQVSSGGTPTGVEGHQADWKVLKRSLKILYLLAAATNTSGEALRQLIASVVSSLKNLRDIVAEFDERPDLQLLSMKILHYLALEDNVRSSIGATSGIIPLLFKIFQRNDAPILEKPRVEDGLSKSLQERKQQDRMAVVEKAGNVLSRLILQNDTNCLRLLNLRDEHGTKPLIDVMIASLIKQENIAARAAEMLRSVLQYADDHTRLTISLKSAPIVLQNLFVEQYDNKSLTYQVSLGLASRAIVSLPEVRYREVLSHIDKAQFVSQLIRNLRHTPSTNKFPSVRRFSLEFILALIEKDDYFLEAFARHDMDMRGVLEDALNSLSEVENFILFSGMIGYARHTEDMEDLVVRCIEAVDSYNSRSRSNQTSPLIDEIAS